MSEPMALPIGGPHEADHPFREWWPGGRPLPERARGICAEGTCYFTPEAHPRKSTEAGR